MYWLRLCVIYDWTVTPAADGSCYVFGILICQPYGILSFVQLWSGDASNVAPRDLKWAIGKYNAQFTGYRQHDSQELLGCLLDGLHEDLNRITNKPYFPANTARDGMNPFCINS